MGEIFFYFCNVHSRMHTDASKLVKSEQVIFFVSANLLNKNKMVNKFFWFIY